MHIPDRARCNWIRERVETAEPPTFSPARKRHILDRLAWSEMFESFLAAKYAAAKRFGLEGCETLIPGMKAMIDRAAELGVESIVMGMPHRGRLNVLANVVRKPMAQIFSEFTSGVRPVGGEGATERERRGSARAHARARALASNSPTRPLPSLGEYHGSGDVKYHLGTSYDRPTTCGRRVHLSLLANPSHLEAVDPVLLGKVRAKQHFTGDVARERTLGVLLHGDGAFAGQGVVYETLDMSALPDYATGGTIHIVVNNQVAFTTDPRSSRSSPYCTDVAKALNAPILHVNGDDVEAVVRCMELAAEWRQAWKTDVVVDVVCYRRHGHNEIDEPMFTQPLMYKKIRAHTDPFRLYQQKLLNEGVVTPADVDAVADNVTKHMSDEFARAKDYVPEAKDWLSSYWAGFHGPNQLSRIRNTGQREEGGGRGRGEGERGGTRRPPPLSLSPPRRADGRPQNGGRRRHPPPGHAHRAQADRARVRRARGGHLVRHRRRLGARGSASVWHPPLGGQPRAPVGPRCAARHVFAPARRDPRPSDRRALHPARPRL